MYDIDVAKKGIMPSSYNAYLPKKDYEHGKKEYARVFTLTQEWTIDDLNIVACIPLISELLAYVIIYPRVIHSFISATFIAKSCIIYMKLDCVKSITLKINKIFKALKLEMDENELKVDLYLIGEQPSNNPMF